MRENNGGRKSSPFRKPSSEKRRDKFGRSDTIETKFDKSNVSGRCGTRRENTISDTRPVGRFRGYRSVIIIDEVGNSGKKSREHEEFFGFAVSVTSKPDEFGALTDTNRWKKGGELKARDDTSASNRKRILRGVRGLGTKTYGYYVNKKNPPPEWEGDDRPKSVKVILDKVLDDVVPDTNGNVYVVVDDSRNYKGGIRDLIRNKSTADKKVDGDRYDSKDETYGDLLQTHDYVASAFHHHIFSGDKEGISILGMIVRKFPGRRSR